MQQPNEAYWAQELQRRRLAKQILEADRDFENEHGIRVEPFDSIAVTCEVCGCHWTPQLVAGQRHPRWGNLPTNWYLCPQSSNH